VTKAAADGRDWDLFEMFIDPSYRPRKISQFPCRHGGSMQLYLREFDVQRR